MLVLLALGSCARAHISATASAGASEPGASRSAEADLAAALIGGDEVLAQQLTDAIVAGQRSVTQSELNDEREVAPNVLLRTSTETRDYQLGVNTVSEYVLCLLEIMHRTSSDSILRTVAPAEPEQCSQTKPCEVCNAQAFPISAEVKRLLIAYWAPRLKVD